MKTLQLFINIKFILISKLLYKIILFKLAKIQNFLN